MRRAHSALTIGRMRRFLRGLAVIALAAALGLSVGPSPAGAIVYQPPPRPGEPQWTGAFWWTWEPQPDGSLGVWWVVWSTCPDEGLTFAIDPGQAPQKWVTWTRRQFLKAARTAHIDVRYSGTTNVTPVPDPHRDDVADFVISFEPVTGNVADALPGRLGSVVDPRIETFPETIGMPDYTHVGTEEVTYAGAAVPWDRMASLPAEARKARILNTIGRMLGMGVLDVRRDSWVDPRLPEVMSIRPRGGGAWTPGFVAGLKGLYPSPYCPSAPSVLAPEVTNGVWADPSIRFWSQAVTDRYLDAVKGWRLDVESASRSHSEWVMAWEEGKYGEREGDRWFYGDIQIEKEWECLPFTMDVTAFSYAGLPSETLTLSFPRGVCDEGQHFVVGR